MKKADLIKLLMGMGVTKANAEKIASTTPDDSTETVDSVAILAEFKKTQNDLHLNDPELITSIQKKEYSKNKDIFIRKLKQKFDLTAEEIKTVTTEKKDGTETIEIIDMDGLVELAAKKSGTNKDKAAETLQTELLAANTKIKKLEEEEIPAIKESVNLERKKDKINAAILKMVSGHGENLRVKLDAVLPSVKAHLADYEIDIDDAGELSIKKNGLAVKSADGTKLMKASEIIDGKLDEWEFIKKSNAPDNVKRDKDGNPIVEKPDDQQQNNGGKKINLPHLEKAKAHAETLKTMPTEK